MTGTHTEWTAVVTLTEADALRLTWTLLRRRRLLLGGWIWFGVLPFLLLSILCMTATAEEFPLVPALLVSLPMLGVLWLVFLGFPLLIRYSVRRAFRNNPVARQETAYRVTPHGIASSNAVARAELAWEAITEVLETKTDFIFFTSKQAAFLVPKRVLSSPDEEARLRQIVRAGAGDRAKLQADSVD